MSFATGETELRTVRFGSDLTGQCFQDHERGRRSPQKVRCCLRMKKWLSVTTFFWLEVFGKKEEEIDVWLEQHVLFNPTFSGCSKCSGQPWHCPRTVGSLTFPGVRSSQRCCGNQEIRGSTTSTLIGTSGRCQLSIGRATANADSCQWHASPSATVYSTWHSRAIRRRWACCNIPKKEPRR